MLAVIALLGTSTSRSRVTVLSSFFIMLTKALVGGLSLLSYTFEIFKHSNLIGVYVLTWLLTHTH